MTKIEFLKLMKFPDQWEEFGMYPEALFHSQSSRYQAGHEEGAEHDRNGAFHWWLRRNPNKEEVEMLIKLSFLEPDAALGADVRGYLRKLAAFDAEHAQLESDLGLRVRGFQ